MLSVHCLCDPGAFHAYLREESDEVERLVAGEVGGVGDVMVDDVVVWVT